MKVLVIVEGYPTNDGQISMKYVHVRNLEYAKKNILVDVLNFSTKIDYKIDGINVITKNTYLENREEYDLLISHAPNLRHHYIFMKKYGKRFKRFLVFFHGHEVVRVSKVYPKAYNFIKKKNVGKIGRDLYDVFKLKVLKRFFIDIKNKTKFIFVSESLYKDFIQCSKINENTISDKCYIIHNCVGTSFEKNEYLKTDNTRYDFITIRSNLDSSAYCIDFLNSLAKENQNMKFLLIGKGDFFNHNDRALNLEHWNKVLKHDEVIAILKEAKCALMPTRRDSQGLMACEMATFGIPLITSNIDVCREVFKGFENVSLIENEKIVQLKPYLDELSEKSFYKKNEKYFVKNTVDKEIELIY